MKIGIFIFLIVTLLSQKVFSRENLLESTIQTGKSDLAVIGVSSGIGAVLGLSSLAFIDSNKKSTPILLGTAIGGIVGLSIVAWGHANSPKQYYSENLDFNTGLRRVWHEQKYFELLPERGLSAISYNFSI
jgi:hypothetical protein